MLHLFSASIFSQKVFRGSKITRVFLQPFCNREVGNPTGAWQAGRHRRAHGKDIQLKSSASASTWHEYRGPRNPLILQDISASLAGLGARSRVSPGIEFLRSPVMCALSGDASVSIDTSPPSEFYRRTTHDDGRRCFWTPCEDVCRGGLLSCCRGPAPARSKPDRPRHGHELVKVGQMRRDRVNRP